MLLQEIEQKILTAADEGDVKTLENLLDHNPGYVNITNRVCEVTIQ